jgi:hypothetical protein
MAVAISKVACGSAAALAADGRPQPTYLLLLLLQVTRLLLMALWSTRTGLS